MKYIPGTVRTFHTQRRFVFGLVYTAISIERYLFSVKLGPYMPILPTVKRTENVPKFQYITENIAKIPG